MANDDLAALAASTAQGWAYALNTVARPAPEHLEAAQEALNALEAADRPIQRWISVKHALQSALKAAQARVDDTRPAGSITIAELRGALDELNALGLGARPLDLDPVESVPKFVADGAIARGDARIAELEEETAELCRRGDAVAERERRAVELRDRFERERDQARQETKAAHAGHSAAIAAARDDSRRAGYLWTLAQLGNAGPGYNDMSSEELRDAASKRLGEVLLEAGQLRHVAKEAGQLRHVAKELVRIGRRLSRGLEHTPTVLDQEEPVSLAGAVLRLADWSAQAREAAQARQRELEDQLADVASEGAPELAAVREERDMLMRARDTQAEAMRVLRAELDAVTSNLVAANRQSAEQRERVAELEAELEAELKRWNG